MYNCELFCIIKIENINCFGCRPVGTVRKMKGSKGVYLCLLIATLMVLPDVHGGWINWKKVIKVAKVGCSMMWVKCIILAIWCIAFAFLSSSLSKYEGSLPSQKKKKKNTQTER